MPHRTNVLPSLGLEEHLKHLEMTSENYNLAHKERSKQIIEDIKVIISHLALSTDAEAAIITTGLTNMVGNITPKNIDKACILLKKHRITEKIRSILSLQ